MVRWIVFTDIGFWKYSWAHLVMSMTELCRWVSSEGRRPRASNKDLQPFPLRRYFSSFSESFDDVMHCRWWNLQSLFVIWRWGTLFLKYSNLCTHSFTDWRASAHLYFWKWKWGDIRPSMVTHTKNSCSAFNPFKCTHTAVNIHTPWTHTRSIVYCETLLL